MKKSTLETLALNGGNKTVVSPLGTGNRFAGNELKYLEQSLKQNTLFYGFGSFVKRACKKMSDYTGMPFVVPCSSGSAAVHLGLIACGIGPGDEVICTPNTDSGSVLGIIEEGAVPVFCDTDMTLQPTLDTLRACRTRRTKAVVVVHLAGYPAPADSIAAWCEQEGLGMVEDCAQSWGTKLNGQMVGSFGTAGAFSFNEFKHLSTGDGGMVTLRDENLYRRVSNYADKHYDRLFDRSQRQMHHGINYRMSELQGAVALAQLERVRRITAHYHKLGKLLYRSLQTLPGARLMPSIEGAYETYWWTLLIIDPKAFRVPCATLIEALQAEGIAVAPYSRYDLLKTPLFRKRIVRPWLRGKKARYPFEQPDGRSYKYNYEGLPNHRFLLDNGIMIHGFGAFTTMQTIREIAKGIQKVLKAYSI